MKRIGHAHRDVVEVHTMDFLRVAKRSCFLLALILTLLTTWRGSDVDREGRASRGQVPRDADR